MEEYISYSFISPKRCDCSDVMNTIFFLIYVKLSLLKYLQIPNTNLIADSLGYVIYQVWLLMRKTKVAEIYTGGHNKQNKPDSRQNEPINKKETK